MIVTTVPAVGLIAFARTSCAGGDDAWQRGRQRSEVEAVDRQGSEGGQREGNSGGAFGHQQAGGRDDEHRPDGCPVDQDPLPPPAVEEHAGEWSDQAVGKQQDHEAGRDLRRPGVVLRD